MHRSASAAHVRARIRRRQRRQAASSERLHAEDTARPAAPAARTAGDAGASSRPHHRLAATAAGAAHRPRRRRRRDRERWRHRHCWLERSGRRRRRGRRLTSRLVALDGAHAYALGVRVVLARDCEWRRELRGVRRSGAARIVRPIRGGAAAARVQPGGERAHAQPALFLRARAGHRVAERRNGCARAARAIASAQACWRRMRAAVDLFVSPSLLGATQVTSTTRSCSLCRRRILSASSRKWARSARRPAT